MYTLTEKIILYSMLAMLAAPFIMFFFWHVEETWDAPEYPHSGFCPDSPSWDAPTDNTLPPTVE